MKIKLLFTLTIVFCFNTFSHSQCVYDFYDTGGAAGNYSNDANSVVTYCPDVPGDLIYADFSSFSVEPLNDGLYVFDGNSTSSPQIMSTNPAANVPGGLPGAYWGGQIPGPFVSSSPDGCLTFQFRSNGAVTAAGWVAQILCGPPAECVWPPSDLIASPISANAAVVQWTPNGQGTSWEVLALPCGAPAPNAATSGIFTTNNPFVFTALNSNSCYQFYVRTWCAPTDFSPWSDSATIFTNPSPAVCGGTFYDSNGPSQNYSDNADVTTTICPTGPGDVVTVQFNSFSTEAQNDALYVYNGNSIASPQIASNNPGANVPGGLPGGFWGSDVPGPFTSSSLDGCLTFRFRSNAAVNSAGWDANVSCGLPNTDTIGLVAFVDTNSNAVMDSGEFAFNYGTFQYQVNNTGNIIWGSAGYGYSIPVYESTNTYDLSFVIHPELAPYYNSAMVYNDISIMAGSGVNYFYFPVEIVDEYNDVAVYIYPLNNPQPGFTYSNIVLYQNLGTTAASGTLSFNKDPLLTINSISPIGTVATADGFTFNYTDLQPFESRSFSVTMTVPTIPTISLGTILNNSAAISGPADDINTSNNTASLSDVVVGSYDPNDIMESHGPQIVFAEFDNDDYLYYTIRFQNTGTANATTVRVENSLDGQLDPNSINMIAASHEYNMTRTGDQLTWQFDDIQLVPESVNSDDSNGYITYKIKPDPGYAIGDIIPSIAEIYFDFNPPIVTETFYTEFVEQLSVGEFDSVNIILFPNPASNIVHLSTENRGLLNVTVFDLLGKVIISEENFSSNSAGLDVSQLAKGMYTIAIRTTDNIRTVKKLIIN